jgi:MAP/microtubule affinity-regulating kinase
MAPEIINKQTYSFPADVWALGILLFKMTTGVFPFRGSDDKDLYKQINGGKIDFPTSISNPLKNMIKKILSLNQNERPTLREVTSEEWLQ